MPSSRDSCQNSKFIRTVSNVHYVLPFWWVSSHTASIGTRPLFHLWGTYCWFVTKLQQGCVKTHQAPRRALPSPELGANSPPYSMAGMGELLPFAPLRSCPAAPLSMYGTPTLCKNIIGLLLYTRIQGLEHLPCARTLMGRLLCTRTCWNTHCMQKHVWDTYCIQVPGLRAEPQKPTGAMIKEDQRLCSKDQSRKGTRAR